MANQISTYVAVWLVELCACCVLVHFRDTLVRLREYTRCQDVKVDTREGQCEALIHYDFKY